MTIEKIFTGDGIVFKCGDDFANAVCIVTLRGENTGKYAIVTIAGLSQTEVWDLKTQVENNPSGYPKQKSLYLAEKFAELVADRLLEELEVLEAVADAANEVLHIMIAEQAELQSEACKADEIIAELNLVPDNACEDITLEALRAGAAFDNAEPTPAFSLHYEMPTNLYDLDELSNVIAEEEWRALGAVDAEISAVKAKLIELNDKRIGIVEECAHWRGKCDRAIEIAEYEASYEANEADADLRQSIWLSTGQDIM